MDFSKLVYWLLPDFGWGASWLKMPHLRHALQPLQLQFTVWSSGRCINWRFGVENISLITVSIAGYSSWVRCSNVYGAALLDVMPLTDLWETWHDTPVFCSKAVSWLLKYDLILFFMDCSNRSTKTPPNTYSLQTCGHLIFSSRRAIAHPLMKCPTTLHSRQFCCSSLQWYHRWHLSSGDGYPPEK